MKKRTKKISSHIRIFICNIISIMFSNLTITSVLLSLVLNVVSTTGQKCVKCDVNNLNGEPEYRAVKLRWNYYESPAPIAFKIRFCELSIWNVELRCRASNLFVPKDNGPEPKNAAAARSIRRPGRLSAMDSLSKVATDGYQASIFDLRTLTNYTFEVKPTWKTDKDPGVRWDFVTGGRYTGTNRYGLGAWPRNPQQRNIVIVQTKGFSARTSKCLANTSDVVVNTGPFFAGKISVENAPHPKCSVQGNRTSPQEVYKIVIDHKLCGSRIIENSRIESMIIVHENRDILTHNSRRYLVVCNFVPETYTLRASVAMPPHLLRRKPMKDTKLDGRKPDRKVIKLTRLKNRLKNKRGESSNHIYGNNRYTNHVRDSRMLASQTDHRIIDTSRNPRHNVFASMSILLGGICLTFLSIFWYMSGSKTSQKENTLQTVDINHTKHGNEDTATIITFKGSPVALVAIKPLGESFV